MRCMGTGVTPKSVGHPKVLHGAVVLREVHRDVGHPKLLCGVHEGMGDSNVLAVVCGHHGVPHWGHASFQSALWGTHGFG